MNELNMAVLISKEETKVCSKYQHAYAFTEISPVKLLHFKLLTVIIGAELRETEAIRDLRL